LNTVAIEQSIFQQLFHKCFLLLSYEYDEIAIVNLDESTIFRACPIPDSRGRPRFSYKELPVCLNLEIELFPDEYHFESISQQYLLTCSLDYAKQQKPN
jgi:hypothetical protein